MRRRGRRVRGWVAACGAIALGGCAGDGGAGGSDPSIATPPAAGGGSAPGASSLDPLLVHEIRISPLTRLSRDEATGQLRVLLHVEMLDAFAHGTKGLGTLRVELYRPAETGERGGEAQELVWTVDLTEPGANAAAYDEHVSRTYLVILTGLPGWVDRWWQGDSREPWLSLQAFFTTWDAGGKARRVEAVYRLQR